MKHFSTHCGDDTCSSCVEANGFLFLAHHAGGFDQEDVEYQMRAAFAAMRNTLRQGGADLCDLVQVTLYLRDLKDFSKARDVFVEYFEEGHFPARMTATSQFLDSRCLCMMDGIACVPSK